MQKINKNEVGATTKTKDRTKVKDNAQNKTTFSEQPEELKAPFEEQPSDFNSLEMKLPQAQPDEYQMELNSLMDTVDSTSIQDKPAVTRFLQRLLDSKLDTLKAPNTKEAMKIQRLVALGKEFPEAMAEAISTGNSDSLKHIGSQLGYEGKNSEKYTKLFLNKALSVVAMGSDEAAKLIARNPTLQSIRGKDINTELGISALRVIFEAMTKKVNSKEVREILIQKGMSRTIYLRKRVVNTPLVQKVKTTEHYDPFGVNEDDANEKTAKVVSGTKPIERIHQFKWDTMPRLYSNAIFNTTLNVSATKLAVARADFASTISKFYYGSGDYLALIRRLDKVATAYEKSVADRPMIKNILGFDPSRNFRYLKLYFEFMEMLPRDPTIFKMTGPPSTWGQVFLEMGTKVKSINAQSDDGAPFHNYKKGETIKGSQALDDQVYNYCQKYGRSRLLNQFPHLKCIIVKRKAEPYLLKQEFDLEDISNNEGFQDANILGVDKCRAIYIPPSGDGQRKLLSILFKSHFDPSEAGLISRLSQSKFSLKNFPYVNGTFDTLIRRITGEAPFSNLPPKLSNSFDMYYSDNLYVVREIEEFEMDPKLVHIAHEHPDFEKLHADLEDCKQKGRMFKCSGRYLLSLDGAKMESSTSAGDVDALLLAVSKFQVLSKELTNYLTKVGPSMVMGTGILGNVAFSIPYQCSGNPITFQLNDIKLHTMMLAITEFLEKDPVKGEEKYIKRLRSRLQSPKTVIQMIVVFAAAMGVTLTTERAVALGPPGTRLVTSDFETPIDLLGFGVSFMPNVGKYKGLYVPVLEPNRLIKSMTFSKARPSPDSVIAKAYSLYMYGGWLNVALTSILTEIASKGWIGGGILKADDIESDVPVPDSMIESINKTKGSGGLTESLVVSLFGYTKITERTAPVVRELQHPFDWGDHESGDSSASAGDVFELKQWLGVESNKDELYNPSKAKLALVEFKRFLSKHDLKIPVLKTVTMKGKKKGKTYEFDKTSSFWRRVIKHFSASAEKIRFFYNIAQKAIQQNPQYSSKYEEEIAEIKRQEEERIKSMLEGREEIQRLREEKKLQKKRIREATTLNAKKADIKKSVGKKVPSITLDGINLPRLDKKLVVGAMSDLLPMFFKVLRKVTIHPSANFSDKNDGQKAKITKFGIFLAGLLRNKPTLSDLIPMVVRFKVPFSGWTFTENEIKSAFKNRLDKELKSPEQAETLCRYMIVSTLMKKSALVVRKFGAENSAGEANLNYFGGVSGLIYPPELMKTVQSDGSYRGEVKPGGEVDVTTLA